MTVFAAKHDVSSFPAAMFVRAYGVFGVSLLLVALRADISAIFNSPEEKIDWSKFSPDALGMHLNYDEMSEEELKRVVDAFLKLQLITPEEKESFAASLADPRMRSMLQSVTENWPETMNRIIKDPNYTEFLKSFQNSIDEEALSAIVGLKDGLQGTLKDD